MQTKTIQCPKGHNVEVDADELVLERATPPGGYQTTMTKDKSFHVCDQCGLFTRDKHGKVESA